uniref:Phosphatidic acid phosphatase type 2/haloperoxidase domain-containing protein n=1 Tax=viral metagenome TaxID=1070528 RepID=A0A6C0B1U7_9ZZZZ
MTNFTGMFKMMMDLKGYLGPFLLFVTTLYCLRNKVTLLSIYTVGYIVSIGINIILKLLIQQPRPSEDRALFYSMIANKKRLGYDQYGMPSGHAQSVFYSTVFIHYALRDPLTTFCYLFVALNTCYQRIEYKNHTVLQVIVGSIVGAIIGWGFYLFSSKKLMGIIRDKVDDNAPV